MQNDRTKPQKLIVISGPIGFDPAAALFAQGIEVGDGDLWSTIERPGNIEVRVFAREQLR